MNPVSRLRRSPAAAFTLIELLTVIAIIGILAAIIIPTVSRVRATARNAQCVSRLRDWGRAISLYANDNKAHYRISNWLSAASNPYLPYLPSIKTGNTSRVDVYAGCPLISTQDAPQVSYVMIWPSKDGNINTPIANTTSPDGSSVTDVPLGRAANPSNFLMMCDSMKGSSTRLQGTDSALGGSSSGFKDLIEPLFGATPVNPGSRGDESVSTRHGGTRINGIFGDGSVRSINGAPAASGDVHSIFAMRTLWFQLY